MPYERFIRRIFNTPEDKGELPFMFANLAQAKEKNPGSRIGVLPVHGAMLNGKLVEQCLGSEKYVPIENGRGMCDLCLVEFELRPVAK